MKLRYAALALVTLAARVPGSLGFTTTTSSSSNAPTSTRTTTAIHSTTNGAGTETKASYIEEIFSDRSVNAEEEKQSLIKRISGNIFEGIRETSANWFSHDETEPDLESTENGICGSVPTKEMTGVDPHVTRLCATISNQLYDRKSTEEFQLSTNEHKTEILHYEDQGSFKGTNTPCLIAVSGDKLFMGWRGTQTLTDGLNDIATSPSSSIALRKHAKTIKTQGAFTSLVHNDIFNHEAMIIEEVKKRGIKEIVTTGHSLGGALGQIAHITIRAQMEDETSPWSALEGVNVRNVCFSAPMSTVLINDYTDETEQFIEDVVNNSCNCIFYNDCIPRGYGYMSFVESVFDNAMDQAKKGVKLPWLLKRFLNARMGLDETVKNAKESDIIQDVVTVLSQYVHLGNIIYYESENAEPRVLRDMGAFYGNSQNKKDILRDVQYEPTEEPIMEKFMFWHNFIVLGPGLSYPDKDVGF